MVEQKPLPFRSWPVSSPGRDREANWVGVGTVSAYESSGSQTLAPTPFPSPEGEGLRETATRLAGLTGALLGWRPDEFWNATPAELATIFAALTPDTANPADRDLVAQMKEQFPDG
jgi:hypothetical protein